MSTDRLGTLRSLVDQNPGDSRTRYMLAMELVNASDLDGAVAEYTRILENDADYVAAYYHRGQALEQLGREDDARASYQDGITACDRIGDEHTKSELQDALEALG